MTNLVFIDTQIYLDFYRRGLKKNRELLDLLPRLKGTILVTQQVAYEVERNRVGRYLADTDQLIPKSAPKLLEIEPFASDDATEVVALNKSIAANVKQTEVLLKSLQSHHLRNVQAIAEGKDIVSTRLLPLFEKAKSETSDQLNRARLRKERGQPPGKKTDTLGDQISWEQVLDAVEGHTDLWLVTRDGDFYEYTDEKPILSCTLDRELKTIKSVKHVHLFQDFAVFMKDAQAAGIFSEEKAETAKVKETIAAANNEIEIFQSRAQPIHWDQFPTPCSKSPDHRHSVPVVFVGPSAYGGYTYKGACTFCGQMFDTGEPYDD